MAVTTNLATNDTAKWRGIRTTVQAVIGLFTGLIAAVWAVDGVPEVIFNYVTHNATNFLLLIGLPAGATGIVSWLWNIARKDVPNG